MIDTVRKRKRVVRACAQTWIITAWYNSGKDWGGRLHEVGKECTCRATWWTESMWHSKKNSWRPERVAEIV